VNKVFLQCVNTLSSVNNQEGYIQAKEKIKEIVWKAIDDLRNRKVELKDLTYSVKLYFDPNEKTAEMKTSPQPYQCALQIIKSGKALKQGETVSFIKVKPFKYGERIFTVKPSESVTSLADINVNDYIRNLLTALNQTFEPMGIKLETKVETEISKWLV